MGIDSGQQPFSSRTRIKTAMSWREDFEKVEEAWHIGEVFLYWLVVLAFIGYIFWYAFTR